MAEDKAKAAETLRKTMAMLGKDDKPDVCVVVTQRACQCLCKKSPAGRSDAQVRRLCVGDP